MHGSTARSLKLDGRYHSPVGEAAGCEPRAHALGTTAGCFIDRTVIPTRGICFRSDFEKKRSLMNNNRQTSYCYWQKS